MSGMFWIALELSIPKRGLNIMLSSTVKKLDAFKYDGVAEFGNTDQAESILLFLTAGNQGAVNLLPVAECACLDTFARPSNLQTSLLPGTSDLISSLSLF